MLNVRGELAVQGGLGVVACGAWIVGAVLVMRGEILRGERSGIGVVWREGWSGGP